MAKVERKAMEPQIETYRDFIAQNEKHIADWENVAKVFEKDFNTKLEYGCSLNSLTVTAKLIANAFEAIEDEKNRVDGYVAEIVKLSAKLDEEKAKVTKFEVGGIYGFNGGEGYRFEVIDRNGHFVKVIDHYGDTILRRARIDIDDNCEYFKPYIDKKMYGSRVEDVLRADSLIEKVEPTTNGKNYFATYKTATENFQKVEADFQVSNEPEEIASDAENGDAVEIAEFEVGKTYYVHSSCDYDTVFEYKVISRTAKTATLENKFGEVSKRKIYIDKDSEYILPEGNYSMCPCITAKRFYEDEVAEIDATEYAVTPEAFDIAVDTEVENAQAAKEDNDITQETEKREAEKVMLKNRVQEELEADVIGYAEELETLASGDYEQLAEYLDGVYDVKITLDGNLRYDSVKIALAVGGPSIYFDTNTGEVSGHWGNDNFSYYVKSFAVETVDDYFADYYQNCR